MTKANMVEQILANAVRGEGISLEEANILINPDIANLDSLVHTANLLTRRVFGNKISMCAIYPAKVGLCSGDCAFCAQSAYNKCGVSPVLVSNLDEDGIICNAKELYRAGVRRYSLVTSGEHLTNLEFDRLLHIFQRINTETKIGICASLGSLTPERGSRLKQVGVSRYHHNIETSRSFFSQICSTHSYNDKMSTIHIARQAGLEICSGGIIGMGETPAQRVEMAFALKELDVDCIPVNILNSIPGTRLEKQSPLATDAILRTIAVFRLLLPNKTLTFAGGREKALGPEEYRGYAAGINAALVGNYLTTSGKAFAEEIQGLKAAGFDF